MQTVVETPGYVILALSPKALVDEIACSTLQGHFNPEMSALPARTFLCNPRRGCSGMNVRTHEQRRRQLSLQ